MRFSVFCARICAGSATLFSWSWKRQDEAPKPPGTRGRSSKRSSTRPWLLPAHSAASVFSFWCSFLLVLVVLAIENRTRKKLSGPGAPQAKKLFRGFGFLETGIASGDFVAEKKQVPCHLRHARPLRSELTAIEDALGTRCRRSWPRDVTAACCNPCSSTPEI